MKGPLRGFVIVMLIIFAALLVLTVLMPRFDGKPIPSTYKIIDQLNNCVNTFQATENNMYLGIGNDPHYKIVTIRNYPELKDIVSNFNRSVKVTNECRIENFNFTPFELRLVWKDTKIFIDLNPANPDDQIFIYYMTVVYKAEASTDSIQQLAEFAAKIK